MTKSLLIPTAFAAVVLFDGIGHGLGAGRWVPLPPLDASIALLRTIPGEIGGWTGTDEPLADADSLPRAGVAGHLFRRYTDPQTGRSVGVLVVCGRPGPISVHTPDVCYQGAGYTPTGAESVEAVHLPAGGEATFRRLTFARPGATGGPPLVVRWAWVSSAGVTAPATARLTFGGEPVLYKVYVIEDAPSLPSGSDSGRLAPFLGPLAGGLQVALGTGGP